jgi:hypothetical protein
MQQQTPEVTAPDAFAHETDMDPKPPPPKMDSEEFKLRLQLETSLLALDGLRLHRRPIRPVPARDQPGWEAILTPHPTFAALNTITGTVFIVLGVGVQILSVWSHRRMVAELERGQLSHPLG